MFSLIAISVAVVLMALAVFWILSLRVVVPANEVHTLQRSKTQVSYGRQLSQLDPTIGATHAR